MLLQNNRKKLKSVKYRFLFALCLCDVFNSLTFVFWSLPIPKGTPGVWGAMGNKASCSAQGFLIQFGILGSFYNCALALYFYKSLCFNMKDEQIAKRYEKWIYIVSIVWCLGTASAGWLQDLYSFSGLGCFYAPEPLRCHRRDDIDCIRGEDANIYAWLYSGVPNFLLFNYIIYSMWMIYMKVKKVSRRAEQWSIGMVGASTVSNINLSRTEVTQSSDSNINDRSLHSRSHTLEVASQLGSITGNANRGRSRYAERTKEAALQAFLYVNAYFITHMWAFVVLIVEMFGGTNPFFLVLLENVFWPLQGFANVFIFLRPRIKSIQKTSPEMHYFTAAYHSVFHYDEVRQRVTESVFSPARPDKGSRQESGTINTPNPLRKSTGEESDSSTRSVPALAELPETGGSPAADLANESCYENEKRFQPVMHEEVSSYDDVDEEPAITEDYLFAQITEQNESRHQKEDNFQQVIHEEAPAHHDTDKEPTIVEDSLIAPRAGPIRVSMAKSVSFND
jgi:hypothetical protein